MYTKIKKIGVFLCAAAIVICMFTGLGLSSVFAEDQGKITLTCRSENVLLANMEWKIYKVGTRESDTNFVAYGDFRNYYVHIDDFSSEHLSDMASTLENMAVLDKLPAIDKKLTDENGKLTFSGLEPGLYLLSGKTLHIDMESYRPSPILFEITRDNNDIHINAKIRNLLTLAGDHIVSTVKKVWDDKDNAFNMRPENVTVEIYRDGELYETIVLDESNNWTYKWEYEETFSDWRVKEKNIPYRYSVIYRSDDTQHAIVNTFDEDGTETVVTTTATGSGTANTTTTSKAPAIAGDSDIPPDSETTTTTAEALKTTVLTPVTTIGSRLPQTGKPGVVVPLLALGGLVITAIALRKRDE